MSMEDGPCKIWLASSIFVNSWTDMNFVPDRLKSKIQPHPVMVHLAQVIVVVRDYISRSRGGHLTR